MEVTLKGQLGPLSDVLLSFNDSQGRYTQTCSEPTGAVAMQSRECHMQVRTSARSMRLSLSWELGGTFSVFSCPLIQSPPIGASTDSLRLSWPVFSGLPRCQSHPLSKTPENTKSCAQLALTLTGLSSSRASLSYHCSARAWGQWAFETSNKIELKSPNRAPWSKIRVTFLSHNAPEVDE